MSEDWLVWGKESFFQLSCWYLAMSGIYRRKQFFVDDLVQQIEGSGVACQQKVSQLNVAE